MTREELQMSTIMHQLAALTAAVNSLVELLIEDTGEIDVEIDPDFPVGDERIQ